MSAHPGKPLALLLTLGFSAVLACSREPEAPVVAEIPIPRFPLRLFPDAAGTRDVFVDSDFGVPGATDGWLVIDLENEAAEATELGATEDLVPSGGRIVLGKSRRGLARVFEVPKGIGVECTARFAAGVASPTGVCGMFFVVPILPEAGEEQLPLAAQIVRSFLRGGKAGMTTWDGFLDGRGAAVARKKIAAADSPRRYAALFSAVNDGFALFGMLAKRVQEFNEVMATGRLALAADDTTTQLADRVQPVKVWGQLRRCVFIRPDEELVLDVTDFQGAERLEFALCLEPLRKKGMKARMMLSIDRGDGVFDSLGAPKLEHWNAGEPMFERFEFAWPALPANVTTVRLKARVDGNCGILLAEPMLRADPPRKRPNLLLISIDTLRKDRLGSYGYDRGTSPFLDSLAARGVRFADFSAVAPYTLPTHATMLTGLLPPRHGAVGSTERLASERLPFLPSILRAHNYHTAGFTGGGFVSEAFGFATGFDRYGLIDPIAPEDDDLANYHSVGRAVRVNNNLERAGDWIESRRGEQWFSFIHTFVVHEYVAPEADLAAFDSKPDIDPERDYAKWLREGHWMKTPPTPQEVKHLSDRYDATIHYCDRMLKRLFERLEAKGCLEDTVIAIVADHGEEFWEHGSLRHSATLYEEQLAVPWILIAPGGPQGVVVTDAISQADVMPTLLELLAIEIPQDLDGHSRVRLLNGDRRDFRDTPLFAQIATTFSRRVALRTGSKKLIENDLESPQQFKGKVATELYDLREDPGEQSNLAESQARDAEKVADALARVRQYLNDRSLGKTPAQIDPVLRKHLQELGYLEY
jgi:arylsulfatase A-like enzyme